MRELSVDELYEVSGGDGPGIGFCRPASGWWDNWRSNFLRQLGFSEMEIANLLFNS
jgi:hypothetical protein